jgi:SprT-like family
MLRSLTRFLSRGADPSQLALDFDRRRRGGKTARAPAMRRAREAADFLDRLRALGLQRIAHCRLTRNRQVMVSFRGSELRVHEAYRDAPAAVLGAIVHFIEGRTRVERRAARDAIVSFAGVPADAPLRKARPRPEDASIIARLTEMHVVYNQAHFGGALHAIPVRLSRRMKSRLGHYTAATAIAPAEIAISWRHIRRHAWSEVLATLLHEMVHQWQDESGRTIDHGAGFRAKAREVGIAAAARRAVRRGSINSNGLHPPPPRRPIADSR